MKDVNAPPVFQKLSSSVGSGKTQLVLEYIRDHLGTGYIYVAPTIELCEEVYARLMKLLVGHPAYANFGPLSCIVTEQGQVEGPFERALKACKDYNPQVPPIVITTTKTFEFLLEKLMQHEKQRFEVFVDEGLPAIRQESFSPGNKGDFLKYLTRDEEGFASPAPGKKEILEWVARSQAKLKGQNLEHLAVTAFKNICELVVSGNYDVVVTETDKSIEALGLLSPEPLKDFKAVTLIVAIFERTLLPILWEKRHGIEFEEFPKQEGLFDAHVVKGPFMTIWHVLHEGDLPSLRNLQRNYETGEANEQDEGQQVITKAAQFIEAHFKGREYCWAANDNFKNEQGILTGIEMPVQSEGMDGYKQCDGVASLDCINPQPWVKNRLKALLELEDDHLYELWRFSNTYQTVGRCSLRVRDKNQPIDVVVVSSSCAKLLSELFVGSQVAGQLGDLPRLSGLTPKEKAQAKHGNAYTPADHSAYSKYKNRLENKGLPVLDKEDWFEQIRKQNKKKHG
ncbi:hypothetical protein ACFFKB_16330 [Mameliella alba]|uniref:hypothetical protein n=1 Tax=Mameliella alba TaxID=561184 RepID=UPI002FCCFEDE